MADTLKTTTWTIRCSDDSKVVIGAAYWTLRDDSGWLEFKDPDHKCMFAIHERNVLHVTRG